MAKASVHESFTTINGTAQDLLAVLQDLSTEDQQDILRLARRRRHSRQILANNDELRIQIANY